MNLPQHAHEPLLMNRLLLRRQFFTRPQLLQHVIHPGHRQLGMQLLLTLAMGVELLAEVTDDPSLFTSCLREGKCVKALAL